MIDIKNNSFRLKSTQVGSHQGIIREIKGAICHGSLAVFLSNFIDTIPYCLYLWEIHSSLNMRRWSIKGTDSVPKT